ncbi:MAG: SAM-dependent methyltransferase, partial [Ruminococcus sp.]|nr:SAM-dependent methyltransferase [Ruminococcus sp.]
FKHADYIISGLPFTSLPTKISGNIMKATKKAVGNNGKFITFQYSLVKKKFFEKYFRMSGLLHEFKNLPPAYVLVMHNLK